jgi:rSAM/selenodomain-associated transferase 2
MRKKLRRTKFGGLGKLSRQASLVESSQNNSRIHVAVIIPVVNEAASISSAIASATIAGADEIIVVDGGSTDGTLNVVRALDCVLLSSLPGRAVQQDNGAKQAGADVMLFLHADCCLGQNSISEIRQFAQTRKDEQDLPLFGAFQQRINAAGLCYRLLEFGDCLRTRCFGLAYGDQGIFISRQLYDQIGGFPNIPLMEDVVLSQAARKYCWPRLLKSRLIVSPRRWQTHGIVRQTLRNWTLLWRYFLGADPETLAKHYRRHDK